MIDRILPEDVATVTFDRLGLDDDAAWRALYPQERELVESASAKRRSEFAAARACAHEALRRLGRPPAAILRGGRGMPLFPEGVVGTVTHCPGLRAAALAENSGVRSLGLDVEAHGPLPDGVLDTIALPEEARWVRAALTEDPVLRWDMLLFTAKEATYKAWYPLTRRWLGFSEARLTLALRTVGQGWAEGVLTSQILVDPGVVDGGEPLERMHGRWVMWGDHIASAIVLRPPPVSGDVPAAR